ncbi:hypothetical protein RESH_00698 [Rhodopirellula europaea SH398]|uniref:Uncharacterized protein n=1 Tax=Rhodopirellula europaea SH398 TaxID=1263868 RepID=M5SB41_9BACT|nr:hypothetical protein RESH_00698 [Rhodopirellula europaea SH398]
MSKFQFSEGYEWLVTNEKKLAQPFANDPLQLRRLTR